MLIRDQGIWRLGGTGRLLLGFPVFDGVGKGRRKDGGGHPNGGNEGKPEQPA